MARFVGFGFERFTQALGPGFRDRAVQFAENGLDLIEGVFGLIHSLFTLRGSQGVSALVTLNFPDRLGRGNENVDPAPSVPFGPNTQCG